MVCLPNRSMIRIVVEYNQYKSSFQSNSIVRGDESATDHTSATQQRRIQETQKGKEEKNFARLRRAHILALNRTCGELQLLEYKIVKLSEPRIKFIKFFFPFPLFLFCLSVTIHRPPPPTPFRASSGRCTFDFFNKMPIIYVHRMLS